MTRTTGAACDEQAAVKMRRFRLFSTTSLASSLLLSGLIFATPAYALDVTGDPGSNGADEAPGIVVVPTVTTDNPVVEPVATSATGGNGTDSTAGTGIPGFAGAPGDDGTLTGPWGRDGGSGDSANGTGGSPAGNGGSAMGGGIGPILVDRNGDITVGATVNAIGQFGKGGNGGKGGAGTGADNAPAIGGAGGDALSDSSGGTGGRGGSATGAGSNGGNGGGGQGGNVDTITVGASGNIPAAAVTGIGGAGTGGNGGAGGNGQGGMGALGGAGGVGGGVGDGITEASNVPGGLGGTGGDGSAVSATGGDGGLRAEGIGGNVGAITVTASGNIAGMNVMSTGGQGNGGGGGAGGSGTGGTGARGGAGGAGGGFPNIPTANSNTGGSGGTGGAGSAADGTGGKGNYGGDARGGSTGNILITAAGLGSSKIEATGGGAKAGDGGNGGAGAGGTAGAGGAGGAGGGIGDIGQGAGNRGGAGGIGGAGGSASGSGGVGGDGGEATAGGTGTISISARDLIGAFSIVSKGGAATGGNGGTGGDGTGKAGGSGGPGGAGGGLGTLGSDGDADNNIAGDGRQGGAGGASLGKGGDGGNGGSARGGDAGTITINRDGATNGTIEVTATGGSGTGGNGNKGGDAQSGVAGTGGAGGNGGEIKQVSDINDSGNIRGNGGLGGAGGSGANATGGLGGNGGDGRGGDAQVVISNGGIFTSSGTAIEITASGGLATGGNGGAGGAAIAGAGGTGGKGGNIDGNPGTGGAGGDGGMAKAGSGGKGGNATAGSAIVTVGNSGDIKSTDTAIVISATGGAATGGSGEAGGAAASGAGGTGGAGGDNTISATGNGGKGGNAGDATGGAGGNGGVAIGGDATVTVTNDGRIFSTGGNGIDITTTSGLSKFGTAGAGGAAEAKSMGMGGAAGMGGVLGMSGDSGNPGSANPGGAGQDGSQESRNGASLITVTNTNLIEVSGIGVRAMVNGDNGTIKVNNTGGTIDGALGGIVVATQINPDFVANSDIDIVNSGLITAGNLEAINTKGAATGILNSGTVLGRVNLTAEGDVFDNLAGGIFAARGTSSFGLGTDIYNNLAGGTVYAAEDPENDEDVELAGLEEFRNGGLITMGDGAAGDSLTLSADAGDVDYTSSGGRLEVDAFLGGGVSGKADRLVINGAVGAGSPTQVVVNVTGVTGTNTDGITVVEAIGGGATQDGDFVLAGGALNVGFFAWDLRRDGATHELFTKGAGAGAYEFAAGITGAQDIWYQTTGTLLQRQADLRPLLRGTQVTPVADYSEPVAPTPVGQVGPGFWLKGVGAYLERDQGSDETVTDRKQSIYGGLAGFDFATEGAGDAWLFGLYGGYLGSKLTFNETDTEWTYDGPTVGAYATYMNEALYVDMLVKADFLSISIDPDDVAPDADEEETDGVNIGGLIDAGYKFGSGEGLYVEPQATLAVLHTEIDDIDMLGGAVDFEDETSVRGRLGLRVGSDYTSANQVVYSSDVTASVWQEFNGGDNDVSIVTPDFPAFGVSDEPGETIGDISLGFSVTAPQGWSGFLRGNYQFSDDLEAISGSGGLRYSW